MFRGRIKVMLTIASHSPLNISETVRNRGLVPKDHQQEMAYGLSNSHVIDDVTWPWMVKLVTPIRLQLNIYCYYSWWIKDCHISKTAGDANYYDAVMQYGRLS